MAGSCKLVGVAPCQLEGSAMQQVAGHSCSGVGRRGRSPTRSRRCSAPLRTPLSPPGPVQHAPPPLAPLRHSSGLPCALIILL